MQRWGTLLELKENHKSLGLKGWKFFIIDFPRNIKTNELNYMISQPTFAGMGVGPGIASFVVDKEELDTLFNILEKTFDEYAQELEADYFKES